MNVIFYFEFVIDGREYFFCEDISYYNSSLPRIGDHIYLESIDRDVEVMDFESDNSVMMERPSDIFLVSKVVHSLHCNRVTVYCEAD